MTFRWALWLQDFIWQMLFIKLSRSICTCHTCPCFSKTTLWQTVSARSWQKVAHAPKTCHWRNATTPLQLWVILAKLWPQPNQSWSPAGRTRHLECTSWFFYSCSAIKQQGEQSFMDSDAHLFVCLCWNTALHTWVCTRLMSTTLFECMTHWVLDVGAAWAFSNVLIKFALLS